MPRPYDKNQRGFTLLELLVVVAILGILASFAVAQFNSYRAKVELSSVMSNCRSLYRAFTLYYMENASEYPSNPGEYGNVNWDFNLTTFDPLIKAENLGGIPFEIEIQQLKKNLDFDPACPTCPNRVYYADPSYQNFYLVLPWGKDPSLLFIVASSDEIKDKGGNLIDNGNYLDGVFIWHEGRIKYH
jgi:prepilin-type N-terminal cleavage/methylation domain-containing protein